MTNADWCRAICLIDGNLYRKWLEDRKVDPKVIDKLVGETGPKGKSK